MLNQMRASLAMRVENEHANRISENARGRKEGRKEEKVFFSFFFWY
jgi:hypothetical protein